MFILRGILRAESQEKILLYLLVRERGYGKAIAEFFGCPLNPIQKQLLRLEEDGVVVASSVGTIREYQLNPRYVFLAQLKPMLKAALELYPESIKAELVITRQRPRKTGKPVIRV